MDWSPFAFIDCYPHCGCEPYIPWLLVRQPWAFASSLAYFAIGYLLHIQAKRRGVSLRGFPFLMYLVGTTSMFAHSNFTKLAMAMDYASIIFLITFFPVMDILTRTFLKRIPLGLCLPLYYGFLIVTLLPFKLMEQYWISSVFFTLGLVHIYRKRGPLFILEKKVLISFLLLGVSVSFMFLDRVDWFCDLKYVPYGHTTWHFGSAVSMYIFWHWYFFETPVKLESDSGQV